MKKLSVPIVATLFMASVATAFAGGSRESTPAKKTYKIATVFKVTGEPWFNRMDQGVKEAGKELGVDAYGQGPTTASAADQVRVVNDALSAGVDAICVDPDDAKALVPAFQRAQKQGVVVVTTESPGQPDANVDLEQIYNQEFAKAFWDRLVKYMGDSGDYAIFVGSLTVPLHNLWADTGLKYAREKYPNLHLVTKRLPVGEDQQKAKQATLDLLAAYPNLKGIIGFGSLGPLGAAQALQQTGNVGKVFIVGTVVPSQAAQYIKDGSITEGIAWDPKWGGYGMTWLAKQILDGGKITNDMDIPHIGKVTLKKDVLRYNGIIYVNRDDIDKYMSF